MCFRVCIIAIGILLGNGMVVDVHPLDPITEKTVQIVAPPESATTTLLSAQSNIDRLHLNMFEAVTRDLSVCYSDEVCLRHARRIESWLCAASACEEKNIEVRKCFKEVPERLEANIDTLICPMVLSPSDETRKPVLDVLTFGIGRNETEDGLVRYEAYILSVRLGTDACYNHISKYLQSQNREGGLEWDRVLSGCRILSGATTREQEEEKFRARFSSVVEVSPVVHMLKNGAQ